MGGRGSSSGIATPTGRGSYNVNYGRTRVANNVSRDTAKAIQNEYSRRYGEGTGERDLRVRRSR